jgi:uncharacterized membrane protein
MGLMMGGMAVIWLFLLLVIAAVVVAVLLASRGWLGALPPGRPRTPEELLRERYARGEIGWPEYREVLVNLLKDRYSRGELELPQYEDRLARLLEDGAPRRGDAGARPEPQRPEGPGDR